MTRSVGRAGAGPRRLLSVWRIRQILSGALIGLAVVAMLRGTLSPIAALIVAGIGVVGWHHAGRRVARARSGLVGEREVARRLRGFGTVVNGWVPEGARFDVDIVVVSPCIAAIEIKRAAGRVRTHDDGSVFVGGHRLPDWPLRQAIRGAVSVRRAMESSEPIDAVLCVTEMTQRPRVVTCNGIPVVLCSQRHLRRVLRRLPRRDDPGVDQRLVSLGMLD